MRHVTDPASAALILADPAFVVPTVPHGSTGMAWLRSTVGRFSSGPDHRRRRHLSEEVLAAVVPADLPVTVHPVESLARAIGIDEPVVDLVCEVAAAYHPGSADDGNADVAVERLITIMAGGHDEVTAARIGVLVQACGPTSTLIDRSRLRPVDEVLWEDPPVPTTRRRAVRETTVRGVTYHPGETVAVHLGGGLAFGAGPRSCPGRRHALALVDKCRP